MKKFHDFLSSTVTVVDGKFSHSSGTWTRKDLAKIINKYTDVKVSPNSLSEYDCKNFILKLDQAGEEGEETACKWMISELVNSEIKNPDPKKNQASPPKEVSEDLIGFDDFIAENQKFPLQELGMKLKTHDWYWAHADDNRSYKNGQQEYKEIKRIIASLSKEELNHAKSIWKSLAPGEFKNKFPKTDLTNPGALVIEKPQMFHINDQVFFTAVPYQRGMGKIVNVEEIKSKPEPWYYTVEVSDILSGDGNIKEGDTKIFPQGFLEHRK